MTKKLRRAVLIGAGAIARAHMNAIAENQEHIELVAVMDVDPGRAEMFADAHKIPAHYSNSQTLLAKEQPDIAIIATPPGIHCELSVQCMEAGAWVLCEKPLCVSLVEMDRIEDAEQQTGRYCSSVFQWRFGAGGQHLKKIVDQELLGRPLVCNSLVTWYRTPEYYAVPWRGKWETESGGCTMIHGIHAIDFMLWLLGEWHEVRAMIGTLDRDIDVEDVSMASVRFSSGAMANLTNSVLSPREESYQRYDFQKGTVEVTHLYGYTNADWRFSAPAGATWAGDVAALAAIPGDQPSTHGSQLRAFLAAMDAGVRPPASGADVRRTIEFLASLYKSAFSGSAVERGSITPDDPFYYAMNGGRRLR
jgi:predicted dehydrogenase